MATVYVVDDDTVVRSIVARFLQFEGNKVEAFESGPELLDRFVEAQPDVVITDLSMPIMTGRELREEIRKEAPEIPCILITGHILDPHIRDAFDEVLEKPLGCRALLDTVSRLTGRSVAV